MSVLFLTPLKESETAWQWSEWHIMASVQAAISLSSTMVASAISCSVDILMLPLLSTPSSLTSPSKFILPSYRPTSKITCCQYFPTARSKVQSLLLLCVSSWRCTNSACRASRGLTQVMSDCIYKILCECMVSLQGKAPPLEKLPVRPDSEEEWADLCPAGPHAGILPSSRQSPGWDGAQYPQGKVCLICNQF